MARPERAACVPARLREGRTLPRPGLTVTPLRDDGVMARQLSLLEVREDDWRLDNETKQVGIQGLAAARAALEEARRRATASVAPEHRPAA